MPTENAEYNREVREFGTVQVGGVNPPTFRELEQFDPSRKEGGKKPQSRSSGVMIERDKAQGLARNYLSLQASLIIPVGFGYPFLEPGAGCPS